MKIRDIAQTDSRFFLKSEYGPLSESWAAMSFSRPQLKTHLIRRYRQGVDFIVYAATSGPEALERQHRARLLSVLRIDLTRTYPTEQRIPKERWNWAQEHYPGQWERSFGVVEGWNLDDLPLASEIAPDSYSKIGQHPNQGMTFRDESGGARGIRKFSISLVPLPKRPAMQDALTGSGSYRGPCIQQNRCVWNRSTAHGSDKKRTKRPHPTSGRDAKERASNLRSLWGVMHIRHANRLLQPSPDGIDSACGSYGPENLHFTHLACNLAKNTATDVQFAEWLAVVKEALSLDLIGI